MEKKVIKSIERSDLKCQRKGCRNHVCFVLNSPTRANFWVIQKPLGFCGMDHMLAWLQEEWPKWCRSPDGKRKYKRFNKGD